MVVDEVSVNVPESHDDFLFELDDSVSRWMFSVPDLLPKVLLFHLRREYELFTILWQQHHFSSESSKHEFRMRLSQLLKILLEYDSFPDSLRQNLQSSWKFHAVVSLQLDKLVTDPLTCGMQFYRWTDQNNRSSTWFTKMSFDCVFSSDNLIWMFRRQRPVKFANKFSSRLDCNNTAEVPFFSLRTFL